MADQDPMQGPAYEARLRLAEQAEQAHLEARAQLSGPGCTPLLVWTARPYDWPQLRQAVEASGNNPYRALAAWSEPRALDRRLPGAPEWATHAYVVVVEIVARALTPEVP